jgi:hypothetical protein
MFHRSLAFSLATSVLLAGCGSQTGAMLTSGAATAAIATQGLAPSVGIARSASEATVQVVPGNTQLSASALQTTVHMVGETEMTDDEIADDADAIGFNVLSTAASERGFVRRTASGWALETTTGIFKKTKVNFVLSGTAGVLAKIAAQENKKSKLTGTLDDAGKTLDVSTVSSALDFGKLTNWFTKGKFNGIVKDAFTREPVGTALVQATSSSGGFVFTATTSPLGEFAIKGLEPGDYTLSVSKAGYQAKTSDVYSLKARKKVQVGIELAATP